MTSRLTGRLVFGIVVIVLGVVFLLDELHIADASAVLRFWAVVPLGYGLQRLTGLGRRRHVASGLLISIFSGWFLLLGLGLVHRDPWDFWPLILVVAGASIVLGALRAPALPGVPESGASTLRAFALWSGTEQKVVSEDFRGGEVTAIMGGHEIDLRAAKTASGPAVLDVFVWWGGVEIRIPEDWKVTLDATALLGGVTNQTRAPAGEAKGHLILKGWIVMGGVDLRN